MYSCLNVPKNVPQQFRAAYFCGNIISPSVLCEIFWQRTGGGGDIQSNDKIATN